MDPVSHALGGRLLAGFDRRKSLGPGSRAAFVLGALAPDLDILLVPRGWDVYLDAHQAWTHAILVSPILALAVAGVVALFARAAHVRRLWIAALVGVLVGHIGFDLVSGSDMLLFWPLVSARFGPHWLAMADWLAVGIVLGATAISVRWRWTASWCAVGLMAVLVAVKAESQAIAQRAFLATVEGDHGEMTGTRPDAMSGHVFDWLFYDRRGSSVRAWQVNARTGRVDQLFSIDGTADDAVVAASRAVPVVSTFIKLAQLPFPHLEVDGSRRLILWSDPRYCAADGCHLSFGAAFSPTGVPLLQVIRIGTFEQTRGLRE